MKYQRAVLVTAVILASGLLASGPALSAQGQATVERTLQVQPGGTLTVDASFGHINVLTASGNSVAVKVEREVRDRYSSDESRILTEHQVEISQTGNDVRIETKVSEDVRERWRDDYRGTPLQVEIVVTVPTSYNVDLDTAGGHIEVADLTGEVVAHTSGGHLTFGNIDGSIDADTSGGHITLVGSSGTADLHTSGGHIEIGQVEGSVKADTSGGNIIIDSAGATVDAQTSGGNIKVKEVMGTINASTSGGSVEARISQQPQGDCSLRTSGGSVTVYLASDIAVDLDAEAGWGGVSLDMEVTGTIKKGAVRGTINGGGPKLLLRTSAGGVEVRKM
jgi:DUF4097 and DUF4098 domain-containing protein YvlB